jgi:N-acetyl-anhydromuramyl-L-alanine amidase AmpD
MRDRAKRDLRERSGGGARHAFPAAVIVGFAAIALLAAPAGLRGRFAAPGARGDAIVYCGEREPIGTRVVLWSEPAGYDASARHRRDRPEIVLPSHPAAGCNTPERISPRAGVRTAADLRERISLFVVHYDESWTSRNCFHVLQDVRGLSVHFLLDLDGTIYQTCDLVERCRHAREANDRSVGVEIAHPGALEDDAAVAAAYRRDEAGRAYLALPSWLGAAPLATRGFVPRPARGEPVRGPIQGRTRTQWDYTDAQYEALACLAGGLARAFPAIALEAPRDAAGRVTTRAFASPAESASFRGVVGHYHLTTDKSDPGPAFDWDRFLAAARRERDLGRAR